MAHKTMIDGTAYTIKGGRTLVDGTAYAISKGRTLVDGAVYDVSFKKWVEKQKTGTVIKSNATVIHSDPAASSKYARILLGTGYVFDEATGTFTLTGTREAYIAGTEDTFKDTSQTSTRYIVAHFNGSEYPSPSGHKAIWKFPTSNLSRGIICCVYRSSGTSWIGLRSSGDSYSVGYTKIYSELE